MAEKNAQQEKNWALFTALLVIVVILFVTTLIKLGHLPAI